MAAEVSRDAVGSRDVVRFDGLSSSTQKLKGLGFTKDTKWKRHAQSVGTRVFSL